LRPLPRLRPAWLAAADDGNPELRLALALAGQHGSRADDPVRVHWISLDAKHPGRFLATSESLVKTPRQVCTGTHCTSDCIALVDRRIVEASEGLLPLIPVPGTAGRLSDIALFLSSRTDDERLLGLSRALMALDWQRLGRLGVLFTAPGSRDLPPAAYGI